MLKIFCIYFPILNHFDYSKLLSWHTVSSKIAIFEPSKSAISGRTAALKRVDMLQISFEMSRCQACHGWTFNFSFRCRLLWRPRHSRRVRGHLPQGTAFFLSRLIELESLTESELFCHVLQCWNIQSHMRRGERCDLHDDNDNKLRINNYNNNIYCSNIRVRETMSHLDASFEVCVCRNSGLYDYQSLCVVLRVYVMDHLYRMFSVFYTELIYMLIITCRYWSRSHSEEWCCWSECEILQQVLGGVPTVVRQSIYTILDWFGKTAPAVTKQLWGPFRFSKHGRESVFRAIHKFQGWRCFNKLHSLNQWVLG